MAIALSENTSYKQNLLGKNKRQVDLFSFHLYYSLVCTYFQVYLMLVLANKLLQVGVNTKTCFSSRQNTYDEWEISRLKIQPEPLKGYVRNM